jgi:pimeloyl-[acyl-carrier protein] methyl ester esterase
MPWYENFSGRRLWYEDLGSGTPILLLHGWCMSSSVWRLQRDSLSADFRIITPDLRGFGKSSAITDDCNLENFVSDTLALVERLRLSSLILAGWSMGAEVAVMAASKISIPVSGLVLVSGTPSFSLRDDFPYGLGRVESEGMALKVRRNVNRAFAGFTGNMFAPGELDDPAVAASVNDILSSLPTPDTSVALQTLKSLSESDIRPLFEDLDLPTLIINGDNDPICLPGASQWMADRISSSSHKIFPGAGHAPFLTMPDKFNNCLRHFIDKLQLRSSGEQNC